MSLKVIGAGVGRTGTNSLRVALGQLLGAPCYHMHELFQRPEHLPAWQAAAENQPVDWDALFSGYAAAVDWPASAYWPELMREYPEAKVLLSVRSSESWWKSASATIFSNISQEPSSDAAPWHAMVTTMLRNRFTDQLEDEDAARAAFEKHNADVLEAVPADRLIVWEAKQGWEPICSGLGLPIPAEPFPVTNSTEEFLARRKAHREEVRPVTVP